MYYSLVAPPSIYEVSKKMFHTTARAWIASVTVETLGLAEALLGQVPAKRVIFDLI